MPSNPVPSAVADGQAATAESRESLRGRSTVAAVISSFVFPLVLTQFIASYAGSNMNVAITSIAADLGTTTHGVQTAITLFTLTMAALMIPGSKLTDILGRKRCFMLGLVIYGAGALLASFAQGLGVLIVGYSLLEGIGSALMIPPIYIILTVAFADLESRAKVFGLVSAAAGLGSAAGPLIGGLITSAISWRASFIAQVLVVLAILLMGRKFAGAKGTKTGFDIVGAVLSAAGLVFVVLGILQSGDYGWVRAKKDFVIGDTVLISEGGISPVWPLVGIGAIFLIWFFAHIRAKERRGEEPLLSTRLFRNRTSNLGLVTQNMQWLILQGSFFVISVFLQTVRGFSRDRNRAHSHRLDGRHHPLIRRRWKAGPTATAGRARASGICHHDRRGRPAPADSRCHVADLDVSARSVPDGARHRGDADVIGQHRAVELPRAGSGRDLGAVAQCLEPRLLTRYSVGRLGAGLDVV